MLYGDIMRSFVKKKEREAKSRKIKKTIYWIIVFSFALYMLFGTNYNVIQLWRVRVTNRNLKINLERFASENEELREHISELRENPEAWERVAREKYGMQKRGERVIIFRDE